MGVQRNRQELTDDEEHMLKFEECSILQDDIEDGGLSQV